MLFVAGEHVYCKTDEGVFVCSVTGTERQRVYTELDSVEVKPEIEVDALPDEAMPATTDEVVAKFQVRADNPHLAVKPEPAVEVEEGEEATTPKKPSSRKKA